MSIVQFLLVFWLLQISAVTQHAKKIQTTSSGHSMEEVLRPMRTLQIVFRLEEGKYSPAEEKAVEVPLLRSLDYLAHNDVPIQLFSKSKRVPTIHPARHGQNRISWLVFIIPTLNSKPIPVWKLISSVQDWSNGAVPSAMFEHFINIVVVHLRAAHAEGPGGFNLNLYREHTPFYFVVFNWVSGVDQFSSHDVWAFDVWFHKTSQRIIGIPGYFKMVEQDGIEGIAKHVSGIRRDFQGDRLAIYADHRGLDYWWKVWKPLMSAPMRHNHGLRRVRDYLGRLLMALAISNNFTFDTIANANWHRYCQISMSQPVACATTRSCLTSGLSLFSYMHTSTVMTSQLPHISSYCLSSMRAPILGSAAYILLVLTLLAVILFKLSSQNKDLFRTLLVPISAFCLQASSVKRRWLYVPWLVFSMFMAMWYGTFLSSNAVAPLTRASELSFDDMVRLNFTFSSRNAAIIKSFARLAKEILNKTLVGRTGTGTSVNVLRQEIILGEQVRWVKHPVDDSDPISRILELNEKTRLVYVDTSPTMDVLVKAIKSLGLDAVVGRERFMHEPYWWRFKCEKSWELRESLEYMKAGGLVYKFLRERDEILHQHTISEIKNRTLAREGSEPKPNDDGSLQLFLEAAFLFMYGMCLSFVGVALIQPTMTLLTSKDKRKELIANKSAAMPYLRVMLKRCARTS